MRPTFDRATVLGRYLGVAGSASGEVQEHEVPSNRGREGEVEYPSHESVDDAHDARLEFTGERAATVRVRRHQVCASGSRVGVRVLLRGVRSAAASISPAHGGPPWLEPTFRDS